MDMINIVANQQERQSHILQDQIHVVSDCILMAGAIKRYHEDVALIPNDKDALIMVEDMNQITLGANALLIDLENNITINHLQSNELIMVWNRLRYMVETTYQGYYFNTSTYS